MGIHPSSASPKELIRYALHNSLWVAEQRAAALHLRGPLGHFQATCREYPVDCNDLVPAVQRDAKENQDLGEWVRDIGCRFARADTFLGSLRTLLSGTMTTGVALGSSQSFVDLERADAERHSLWLSFQQFFKDWHWGRWFRYLAVPSWLETLLAIVRRWMWWSKRRGDETAAPPSELSPEPKEEAPADEPSEEEQPSKTTPPSKPFAESTITAGFPTYADGTLHTGIDLVPAPNSDAAKNPVVHPIGPGEVVSVCTDPSKGEGYGRYVVVKHILADGKTVVYTRYAHLESVTEDLMGKWITAEDGLGVMGASGGATGPHVHLEVFKEFKPHHDYRGKKGPENLANMLKEFIDPEDVLAGSLGEFCTEKPDPAQQSSE
ncbi:MAG: M23 family metallopeptidase [Anaerolineales bacterium]